MYIKRSMTVFVCSCVCSCVCVWIPTNLSDYLFSLSKKTFDVCVFRRSSSLTICHMRLPTFISISHFKYILHETGIFMPSFVRSSDDRSFSYSIRARLCFCTIGSHVPITIQITYTQVFIVPITIHYTVIGIQIFFLFSVCLSEKLDWRGIQLANSTHTVTQSRILLPHKQMEAKK